MMENLTIPGGHLDLKEIDFLEIKISSDGKTVWINNEEKCLFRAQEIKQIEITDGRKKHVGI